MCHHARRPYLIFLPTHFSFDSSGGRFDKRKHIFSTLDLNSHYCHLECKIHFYKPYLDTKKQCRKQRKTSTAKQTLSKMDTLFDDMELKNTDSGTVKTKC